jgi:predicted O-methyltransferase YrrM
LHLDIRKRDLVAAAGGALFFLVVALIAEAVLGAYAPAVIAATGMGLLLVALTFVFRRIEDRAEESRVQLEAAMALYRALDPVVPLPSMSGFAMTPDSAVALYRLLRETEPTTVVETGSGVSTLVIGYVLRALGRGRLVSLDASADYAERTRKEVERHGLGAHVTVVHAPLTAHTIDGETHRWHDASALEGLGPIDFVCDDGPPAHLGPLLRYASLPLLAPRLAKGAVVFMNFVGDEERAILERWKSRFSSLCVERLGTRKGNAILRGMATGNPG